MSLVCAQTLGATVPKKRSKGDGALFYVPSRKIWYGVIDLGFWPDGRRRQKSVSSKSQAECRRKLELLKAEIAKYGAPLDKTTKVAAYAETWLETVCRPNVASTTYANRASSLKSWIIPVLGTKLVSAIKPPDVRAVVKGVTDAGKSSSTARKAYDVLSLMLESARRDGLCARNVAEDVTPPRMAISSRGALEPAQAVEVLRLAAGEPNGTRWWVALLLGLRQSERTGARIDSIDFATNTFTVRWALGEVRSFHGCGEKAAGKFPCGANRAGSCPQRIYNLQDGVPYIQVAGHLFLKPPKSGKPRTIPISPGLAEALRRHIEANAHLPNPHGLIWRHADGSPYLPAEDQADWRDIIKRAGVDNLDVTTHWGRHTTATLLMELGVDAKVVGEIVGHGSVDVTRKHYQHVSSAVAREAVDRLAAQLELTATTTETSER